MATVHPTAVIESGAELDQHVQVGPYAIIGAEARIGARAVVGSHTVLEGRVELGSECRIGSHNEAIHTLTEAYRIVFFLDLNTSQALERMEQELPSSPEVQRFIDFIKRSLRGISK